MNLNEVLGRYGGRPERQLNGKITEGKRIDLAEFSKARNYEAQIKTGNSETL